jgi:hypothetical protein
LYFLEVYFAFSLPGRSACFDRYTYTVQATDIGHTITVIVIRATNSGSISSAPTATVIGSGLPAISGIVSISGNAQVGQTLTANTGALGGSGTITYQWMRGTTVVSANSSSYTVQAVDYGSRISVVISRSGNSGSVSSAATAPVTLGSGGSGPGNGGGNDGGDSSGEINIPGSNLADKLAWLERNARSGGTML